MTAKPIVVRPQDSIQDAMETMAQRHIRHLPVVDAEGALVGLLTDRDLRRVTPSPLVQQTESAEEILSSTKVERVMLRSPATIASDQPLKAAVQLMVDKKYGALPVVDGGRLVGILSQIDVLRLLLRSLK